MDDLEALKARHLVAVADAADEDALEAARLAALGKKGEVALKMRELGKMTPEERQTAGPALNALKDELSTGRRSRKWLSVTR
jgi:phenylalanyl-tRNA synthetase alpha chain